MAPLERPRACGPRWCANEADRQAAFASLPGTPQRLAYPVPVEVTGMYGARTLRLAVALMSGMALMGGAAQGYSARQDAGRASPIPVVLPDGPNPVLEHAMTLWP